MNVVAQMWAILSSEYLLSRLIYNLHRLRLIDYCCLISVLKNITYIYPCPFDFSNNFISYTTHNLPNFCYFLLVCLNLFLMHISCLLCSYLCLKLLQEKFFIIFKHFSLNKYLLRHCERIFVFFLRIRIIHQVQNNLTFHLLCCNLLTKLFFPL